jgi:hypothetical protein
MALLKVAEMSGVPPSMLRDDETVQQLRAEREKQIQQAQQMEQMSRMAETAEKGGGAMKDMAAANEKLAAGEGAAQEGGGGPGLEAALSGLGGSGPPQ